MRPARIENATSVAAIRKSHDKATPIRPPMQKPRIIAIVGFSHSVIAWAARSPISS
jgi:hypothetical protein